MEFHILMCYAMFVDWRSSTDDSKWYQFWISYNTWSAQWPSLSWQQPNQYVHKSHFQHTCINSSTIILYLAYLRDEVHKCERQLCPLSVVCASLSAVYLIENITIAKVSIVKFNETRYSGAVICLSNNQVPLSTGDLQDIPEVNIKCNVAGELVPCLIAVPTYENNTCFNALLKVNCIQYMYIVY